MSMSSLPCAKVSFSKMTQLKQTNLENQLHISTDNPKEGFHDTVFEYLNISWMN